MKRPALFLHDALIRIVLHTCVSICVLQIYMLEQIILNKFFFVLVLVDLVCLIPCCFMFLSVNMQSWTRTRSILRLRNPCVLTSRYLLICPTLKRGLICAGKGQQLNSVLTILKIQLKKIFWAFWVFFTEHSTRPTYLIHIPLPAFLNCSWFLSWSPNICQN